MASGEAYSVACINLFWRLWVELERVSTAEDAEILRLELILLLDACRSERWRLELDICQRLSLHSTIEEVLDALNSASEVVPQPAIGWAQNRLLDAALEHCDLVPAIRILRKARTLYAYHAEPLPAGRLHDDPALEAVHHSRAQLLES